MTTAQDSPTIRPATPADAELIAKLVHELALYERAPEDCHATPDAVRATLFGPRPAAEAIIAEINGEPCGFAVFFHNYSTWECAPGLYVEDLFVRPAWRRRGIGRALLARLASIARHRGCKRMELSVLDWNKPARDFYASIGMAAQAEWTTYRAEAPAIAALADEDEPQPADDAPAPGLDPDGLVVVHTDGGAQPNPGVGGWAAVLRCGELHREVSGGELGTTNNRMELTAAIRALEALKRPSRVEIHTDSAYLKNGITAWMPKWKRMGWKRGAGRNLSAVKNADLWKALDALCQRHTVDWKWLRGHAGHADNERADALCGEAIARLVAGSTAAQRRAALDAEERRQEAEQRG